MTSLDLAGLILVASRTLNLDEATVVSLADRLKRRFAYDPNVSVVVDCPVSSLLDDM